MYANRRPKGDNKEFALIYNKVKNTTKTFIC